MSNPKTDIPRSAGTYRPAGRIQPGWWVHLEPSEGAPEDTTSGWEEVNLFIDYTNGWRTIRFEGEIEPGGGNAITVHKNDEAVTLTAREAKRLGLTAETVKAAAA